MFLFTVKSYFVLKFQITIYKLNNLLHFKHRTANISPPKIFGNLFSVIKKMISLISLQNKILSSQHPLV